MRRRIMTALATVLTVGLGLGLAPSSSVAVESHPPSPAGEFVIEGRGYGHGRGLSQWGAQGAATQGLSSSQILAFYYPGTSLTGQPNSDIRVRLSTGRPQEVAVDGQAGLRLHWQGGVLTLPVSSASGSGSILSWRLLTGPGGLVLDYVDSGAAVWRRYSVVPGTEASFFATSGTVRLVQPNFERREYRGGVGAIIAPSGALSTYNTVLMEDYLRSVVPSEMPASWHPQALAAQATAARTYASFERHSSTAGTDTCDTTACQVYSGARLLTSGGAVVRSYESAATNQAIVATSGSVVITGGPFSYAFTQFSSSNGGWTSAGTLPYQVAKPDPYDGALPSTAHAWTARVSATAVRNAFPTAGQPLRLSVLARTGGGEWGGRVTRVAVVGTAGTVTVSGDAFRSALGLRSAWWTTSGAAQASGSIATDVNGDGTSDLFGRQLATGALMFYAGRPDGTYTSPRTVGTGWEMHDWIVAAGDVTGDGVPDLYAREAATGTLWLYPLRRDGSATGGWPSVRGGRRSTSSSPQATSQGTECPTSMVETPSQGTSCCTRGSSAEVHVTRGRQCGVARSGLPRRGGRQNRRRRAGPRGPRPSVGCAAPLHGESGRIDRLRDTDQLRLEQLRRSRGFDRLKGRPAPCPSSGPGWRDARRLSAAGDGSSSRSHHRCGVGHARRSLLKNTSTLRPVRDLRADRNGRSAVLVTVLDDEDRALPRVVTGSPDVLADNSERNDVGSSDREHEPRDQSCSRRCIGEEHQDEGEEKEEHTDRPQSDSPDRQPADRCRGELDERVDDQLELLGGSPLALPPWGRGSCSK